MDKPSGADRRHFIRQMLAAGAVAPLAACGEGGTQALSGVIGSAQASEAAAPLGPMSTDVVVIGAGISGLMAARRLAQKGASVLVLEANARVGGRTESEEFAPGRFAELGATWVGPTQDRILALIRELGLSTFKQFTAGQTVYFADGQRSTFSDTGPTGAAPLDPAILPELALLITQIDSMAAEVPPGAPWKAAKAEEYDRQSLESWLRANSVSDKVRRVASAAFETLWGGEARDISLLAALWLVAGAGNETTPGSFERLIATGNGAQDSKIVQGSQSLSQRMAADLGSRVILQSRVRRIVQQADGVQVVSDRTTVRARRVIVSVPTSIAGRIDYSPALPVLRDQLMQRSSMGHLIKCEAFYDKPFWRDLGLNGSTVSDTGPAKLTFDVSPVDGQVGVMLGFVGGDEARRFAKLPRQALQDAVIANFVTYFGEQARAFKKFEVKDWALEEHIRGGPITITGTGTLCMYGPALLEPVGRIHWAGTDTAQYWHGYMEGAVRAGERAALEVMQGGLS